MEQPRAPEIVELKSERLTIETDLSAYGLMGVTKDGNDAILQVAVEVVGQSRAGKTFLRVFEALTKKGVGIQAVTRDGDKTKIAVYTTCSSAEAKKALDRAGGDS
jgi:aspartokinase